MSDNGSTSTLLGGAQTIAHSAPTDWVLGQNAAVRKIVRDVEMRGCQVQCTVLVSGETGTGKEIWAKQLHAQSPRASKPFVPVNCAALTVSLAESQLFGHEKGAFTGAAGAASVCSALRKAASCFSTKSARCRSSCSRSCFAFLQQQEVTPVGSSHPIHVNVQVVAATNRDLEVEVAEGRFREDLYYRLNMVEFNVPPLRNRVDDIPAVCRVFLAQVRGPIPTAAVAARRRHAAGILRISLARQRSTTWRTSSNRPMCSIASRGCPNATAAA